MSLAVLFLDQWTKGIITRTMEVHQSRSIVRDFFDLTYVRNTGAAFGLFASVDSSMKAILLNSVAVVVFLIVSAYALRSSHKSVRLQVGPRPDPRRRRRATCSTACASATSSTSSTSRSRGHHWPAFNVADSAICIGVGLLFLDMLAQRGSAAPRPDPAPGS